MDDYMRGYIDGIAEGERALSNYTLLDFIKWRHRMRNRNDIKKRNREIRIGLIEDHIKDYQRELQELNKEE